MSVILEAEGRKVRFTHPEKLLWPEDNITKEDLLKYFVSVSDPLMHHLSHRPLSFTRWPDGIEGKRFYQKNPPSGTPPWIPTFSWQSTRYLLLSERATLAFFAQMGMLEIHSWLCREPDIEHPDLAVIDLDPMPPYGFEAARRVALLVQTSLRELNLHGFLKTSGATGIHIFIPLIPERDSRSVAQAVRRLGEVLKKVSPVPIALERRIKDREGVYFDFGQNAPTRTMVAPYSPRPRPGAPVSCPLWWEELSEVDPQLLNLRTVPDRLKSRGDPWAHIEDFRQSLDVLETL